MNSPLHTRIDVHQFGGVDYHIRCLIDGNQFDDPEGVAEALGISPASWPFFGMRWPAGLLLADLVSRLVLGNGRMLELGCGLGIASLVANARGADILATDYHPMAADFLRDNSARNALFQPETGLFCHVATLTMDRQQDFWPQPPIDLRKFRATRMAGHMHMALLFRDHEDVAPGELVHDLANGNLIAGDLL
jgi:predicted nicotinamide N-methyase